MRMTHSLVLVAEALMEDPTAQQWGYDLTRRAHVRSGVLYPILHRMLDDGWLTDGWESPTDLQHKKAPPRRYYKLTDRGVAELGAVLARAASDARFRSTAFRPGLA
jgi:PadR family transcriptional regulator PadR